MCCIENTYFSLHLAYQFIYIIICVSQNKVNIFRMYFDLCTVLKFFLYPFLLLLRSWPDKAGLCLSVSVSVRSQIVVLHFECDSLYNWMSAARRCAMWPGTLWSRPRDVKVQISSISKVYPAALWQREDSDECPPPPLQIPVRIFFGW